MREVVCFGEVLWDILPSGPLPGGAPMNVAFHLKKLNLDPLIISKVGSDEYGDKLVGILRENGLNTKYIEVDNIHPTGLVYANASNGNEVVYDIVKPSAWDFIEYNEDFTDLVKQSGCFVFGSLASRDKQSRNTLEELLEIAPFKVCDINLRPPHFDRPQVENLLRHTSLLKMNLNELDLITGWYGKFEDSMARIQYVQDRFRINTIIVTRGDQGAMVNHEGIVHQHPGYKVEVADTIGSGDAFLAGFLAQRLQHASVDNALEFASALGAFIATKPGACPDYQKKEVFDMMNRPVGNGQSF